MSSHTAQRIVGNILEDLTDRTSFRHTWNDMDDDIRRELYQTWEGIVDDALIAADMAGKYGFKSPSTDSQIKPRQE